MGPRGAALIASRMRILMSRPDHFEIAYEINPWMHIENPARAERALSQWRRLYERFRRLGVEVELVDQPRGLPDFVFTANGGLVLGRKVVLPAFRPAQRRPETGHFKAWFQSRGYETLEVKNHFEGEGDALFFGDTLCIGHGRRTSLESHAEVRDLLGVRTLSLELVDPRFYHLDTCFAPLGDAVLYYPGAFSPEGRAAIENLAPPEKRIVLSPREAEAFAANCVLIGGTVISSCSLASFQRKLASAGLAGDAFELDELLKAGGGAKCLSLKLDNP